VLLLVENENEPQRQRREYISSMLGEEVSSIMPKSASMSKFSESETENG